MAGTTIDLGAMPWSEARPILESAGEMRLGAAMAEVEGAWTFGRRPATEIRMTFGTAPNGRSTVILAEWEQREDDSWCMGDHGLQIPFADMRPIAEAMTGFAASVREGNGVEGYE
jgi:hypothetical protein